jgi:hypothetical protein
MSRVLTLVSGAKKNVGDFLIFQKAKEMIEHHLKPSDTVILKRSEEFKPHLERVNETDAIIICGGPGYRRNFYPGTYPFLKFLDKIRAPIVPFGLGWQGEPLYLPKQFQFSTVSQQVIRRLHRAIPLSTTRDEITKKILEWAGVTNVINSGCPTLFDLKRIETHAAFRKPEGIERIAVSMVENTSLHAQNMGLLQAVKNRFPKAHKTAVFHRGIGSDDYTSETEGTQLEKLVTKTRDIGYEIIDLAYDLGGIRTYHNADLHVGYRVHAHAYCVSKGIPTFLLWEDGRGQGMSLNLGLKGVRARKPIPIGNLPLPRRLRASILYGKGRVPVIGRPSINERAINDIMALLEQELESNFSMFDPVPERLRNLYAHLQIFFSRTKDFLYSSD